MSSKISALPAATTCDNADLFTDVQGGTNKKITRPVLLTATPGEVCQISDGASSLGIAGDGTIQINPDTATSVFVGVNGSGDGITVDDAVGVVIAESGGRSISLQQGGSDISITGGGNIDIFVPGGNANVSYAPANSGDWVGPAPTEVALALDRIARVVSVSGAVPIP